MEKEQIYNLIDAFFHDELSKTEESILFTVLSENNEGKEYFKEMLKFSEVVKLTSDEVPENLDREILIRTVKFSTKKKRTKYQLSYLFAFLIAVLFIFASFFFYQKLQDYNREIKEVHKIVDYQNKVISLFINSLPAARVNETLQNEIIIKKNL